MNRFSHTDHTQNAASILSEIRKSQTKKQSKRKKKVKRINKPILLHDFSILTALRTLKKTYVPAINKDVGISVKMLARNIDMLELEYALKKRISEFNAKTDKDQENLLQAAFPEDLE